MHRKRGIVTRIHEKGYAFVRIDGEPDHFLRPNDIAAHNIREGDRVEFDSSKAADGRARADRVTVMTPRTMPPPQREKRLEVRLCAVEDVLRDGGEGGPQTSLAGTTDPITSMLPMLPAPLAASLQSYVLVRDNLRSSSASLSSSSRQGAYESIKINVQDFARFFLWSLYSTLLLGGGSLPEKLRIFLAGLDNSYNTTLLWQKADGPRRCADEIAAILHNTSQASIPVVARILSIWSKLSPRLREIIQARNALQVGLSSTKEELFLKALASFETAAAALLGLRCYLLAIAESEAYIVNGLGPWRGVGLENVPALALCIDLNPLITFRHPSQKLAMFTTTKRDPRNRDFKAFGPGDFGLIELSGITREVKSVVADPELAAEINAHCPSDLWFWQLYKNDVWTRELYSFSDLGLADTLYGRSSAITAVENALKGQTSERRVIFVTGEQGVGKSAVSWHLARSNLERIAYFFRMEDRHRRNTIESFFESAAIQLARILRRHLTGLNHRDEFSNLLAAAVKRSAEISRVLVIVIDGMDELRAERVDDYEELLKIVLHDSPSGIAWVCATRRYPDAAVAAHSSAATSVKRVELSVITPAEAKSFLREELNRVVKDSAVRSSVLADAWIDVVAENPDAGLPLYLHEVVRSVVERSSYHDPHAVPPTLAEHWNLTTRRLKALNSLSLQLLVVLALGYRPLDEVEIAGIYSFLANVETLASLDPCFKHLSGGWWIEPSPFREHLRVRRSHELPEVGAYREAATAAWITWLRTWTTSTNSYAAEFLARHLALSEEPRDYNELCALANDPAFALYQAKLFPERPELTQDTVQIALDAACERCDVGKGVELALRRGRILANRAHRVASEFQRANYAVAGRLARVLEEEQDRVLWNLLVVQALLKTGKRAEGAAIINDLKISEGALGLATSTYELPAGVILSMVASVEAALGTAAQGLSPRIVTLGLALLGDRGKRLFFESLDSLKRVEYSDLLPSRTYDKKCAFRAIGRLRGRQVEVERLTEMAREKTGVAADILAAGAVGCAEAGNFERALTVAAAIGGASWRREALCIIAAEAAMVDYRWADIVLAVVLDAWDKRLFMVGERGWPRGAGSVGSPDEVEERLEEVIKRTDSSSSHTVLEHTALLAWLGVARNGLGGYGDGLLSRAETIAGGVDLASDLGRRQIINAYLRCGNVTDASRVVGAIRDAVVRKDAKEQVLAATVLLRVVAEAPSFNPAAARNIRCLVAGELARTGRHERAERLIAGVLASIRPPKAARPDRWGIPRLLGEIAGALARQSETEKANSYFRRAKELIEALPRDWRRERAYGLVNLLQALVPCNLGNAEVLAADALVATRLDAPMRVELLAEIWVVVARYVPALAGHVLVEAKQAAREGRPANRVEALLELARRQSRGGDIPDARNLVAEARALAFPLGDDRCVAAFLKGAARCGALERVELVELKGEIQSFVGKHLSPDLRARGYRAEVERLVSLARSDWNDTNLHYAEAALHQIDEPEQRAHAARTVAQAYAEFRRYEDALRFVEPTGAIAVKRSELIADVAKAVSVSVDENPTLAREFMFRLLSESSRYLDGTYRVASYMIASKAFDEDFSREVLAEFADALISQAGANDISEVL